MARILLVEDDEAMRQFLLLALEKAGYTVVEESNGAKAMKTLEDEGPFDLLLTDIVMPGMDGFELAKRAKKKQPDLRLMYITGFTAVAVEQQKAVESQHAQIISKPFHLNDLVAQVEEILSQSS